MTEQQELRKIAENLKKSKITSDEAIEAINNLADTIEEKNKSFISKNNQDNLNDKDVAGLIAKGVFSTGRSISWFCVQLFLESLIDIDMNDEKRYDESDLEEALLKFMKENR